MYLLGVCDGADIELLADGLIDAENQACALEASIIRTPGLGSWSIFLNVVPPNLKADSRFSGATFFRVGESEHRLLHAVYVGCKPTGAVVGFELSGEFYLRRAVHARSITQSFEYITDLLRRANTHAALLVASSLRLRLLNQAGHVGGLVANALRNIMLGCQFILATRGPVFQGANSILIRRSLAKDLDITKP